MMLEKKKNYMMNANDILLYKMMFTATIKQFFIKWHQGLKNIPQKKKTIKIKIKISLWIFFKDNI